MKTTNDIAFLLISLLIVSHVLTDFYFQGEYIAKFKKEKKRILLLHAFIFFVVSFILTIFFTNSRFVIILILSVLHYLTDLLKIKYDSKDVSYTEKFLGKMSCLLKIDYTPNLQNNKKKLMSFLVDQFAHISYIVIIYVLIFKFNIVFNETYIAVSNSLIDSYPFLTKMNNFLWTKFIILLSIVLFMINGGTVILQSIFENKPTSKIDCLNYSEIIRVDNKSVATNNNLGLKNGQFIGILERIIVFFLVVNQNYTAIAFVITAKSIARFKKFENDELFSEYYLIGTLTSFLIAISCGILFLIVKNCL